MNLFRSEEHLKRWLHYFHAVGDYVLPVSDWAVVFSSSMFRRRLDPDYLSQASAYLEDYRQALRAKGKAMPAPDRILSTVMFTDIVDSTKLAARIGDSEWRKLLKRHDDIARSQIDHFGGRVIKHTGDGFLSTFKSPARAIRCATAIGRAMPDLGLEVRAGIHSGECEVIGEDLGGIAVHIGARIGALAGPGEVLVSGTVKDAVTGSNVTFDDRGLYELKGVPGSWQLYVVSS
ncbi:MAG: adenylate/guanylate cyclase domain-containing protein [Acidimicrobiia bacterium]|nr:adenylate/guanylate cyclase domain-containing protein [Acidimicrobiia bacterium]